MNPPGVLGGGARNAAEALKHFATAFAFLLAGLVSLIWNDNLLAAGGARTHQVIAGLHFITLGWLSLSIFGALQVFTGVALGDATVEPRLASVARWFWTFGVLFFISGLATLQPFALVIGLALLGVAMTLYFIQIGPSLIRAKRGQTTRVFIVIGFVSLLSAWLLGALAGLARVGSSLIPITIPPGYLEAHILFGLFGWVGSMVIGVGSHLVPMFALSRDTPRLALKLAMGFWLALPFSAWCAAFFPDPWIKISWALAALGTACWAVQFLLYFRYRIRREKDHGLFIAAMATIFLIVGWLMLFATEDRVPFIALLLFGWLSFFTLGIYHRVIPFLVWFTKYSKPQKGFVPPRVKDLMDPRLGVLTGGFIGIGLLVFLLGLATHSVHPIHLGAFFMLVGSLLSLGHLFPLNRKTPLSTKILNSWRLGEKS